MISGPRGISGIGEIVKNYWLNNAGRALSFLVEACVYQLLGDNLRATLFTVFTFVLLLWAISFLLRAIFQVSTEETLPWRKGFIFSGLMISFLFFETFAQPENWFWISGTVAYLWPLIFVIFIAGFCLREKFSYLGAVLCIIPAFFHEISGIALLLLLGSAWILRPRKNYVIYALIGAISLGIVFSSPGYAVRASHTMAPHLSLSKALLPAFFSALKTLYQLTFKRGLLLIVVLLTGVELGRGSEIRSKVWLNRFWGLGAIFAFALAMVTWLPFWLYVGGGIPNRVFLSLSSFIVFFIFFAGFFYSSSLRTCLRLDRWVGLLFWAYFLNLFVQLPAAMRTFEYSRAYDDLIRQVRVEKSRGRTDLLRIPPLPDSHWIFAQTFHRTPGELWINGCFQAGLELPFSVGPAE